MLGGSEEGRVGEGDESSFSQKLSESMAAGKKNFLRPGDRQANNAPRPDPASAVRTASSRPSPSERPAAVKPISGTVEARKTERNLAQRWSPFVAGVHTVKKT